MDTISPATPTATGLVPLGTIRRQNRTIHISHDTDRQDGTRFVLKEEASRTIELGAVTITTDKSAPERCWLPAAHAIGISEGRLVEASIIRCLRDLVRSIHEQRMMPADHGFVRYASKCPYAFEVEELEPWRA